MDLDRHDPDSSSCESVKLLVETITAMELGIALHVNEDEIP